MNWFKTLIHGAEDVAPQALKIASHLPLPPATAAAVALAPSIISLVQSIVLGVQKAHEPIATTVLPIATTAVPPAITGAAKKSIALDLLSILIEAEFAKHGVKVPQAVIHGLPDQIERSLATLKFMALVQSAIAGKD